VGTPPPAPPGYPFGYTPSPGRSTDELAPDHSDEVAGSRGDLPETGARQRQGIWHVDERAAWRAARRRGAGMVIAFVAEWSKPANQLEREVFGNPRVARAIASDFVALKIDITEDTAENREQLERYRVLRLPVVLVLDPHGGQLDRIEAPLDSDAFMARLSAARTRLPALRAGL